MSKRARYPMEVTTSGSLVIITTKLWGSISFENIQKLEAFTSDSELNPEETHYWVLVTHNGGHPYYLRCLNSEEQMNIMDTLEDFM